MSNVALGFDLDVMFRNAEYNQTTEVHLLRTMLFLSAIVCFCLRCGLFVLSRRGGRGCNFMYCAPQALVLHSCVHSVTAERQVVVPAQRHSTLRRCRTVAAVAAASGTMAASGSGGKQVPEGPREMHSSTLHIY